jgi:hypothetical protein
MPEPIAQRVSETVDGSEGKQQKQNNDDEALEASRKRGGRESDPNLQRQDLKHQLQINRDNVK